MSAVDLSSAETAADVLSVFASLQSKHSDTSPLNSAAFASFLDSLFPSSRSLFTIPRSHPYTADAAECVYLCGNSLGLQPKLAVEFVRQEMDKWGQLGVEGHFRGDRPWVSIDEPCLPLLKPVVGAEDEAELGVMNSLTVNLHLLLTSFYTPTAERFIVIMEEQAFCSDHHVVRSQLALHGQTVEKSLVQLRPKVGETFIRTADIVSAIKTAGSSLALVLLPGIQFYTGQLFDMAAITAAAHSVGAYAGFDLAHAVGNVRLRLHEWQVDFASWCSYKYLNSGPGGISGIFFHRNHHARHDLPRLAGWWGQTPAVRFLMQAEHQPIAGAQQYQLSNPPVLPAVCLQASLLTFQSAGGMEALRQRSLMLTAYLELLLTPLLSSLSIAILTPPTLADRGCQLSLLLPIPIRGLLSRLEAAGVLCDGREPNVVRVAPAPLYNTFHDVWKFVGLFETAFRQEKETPQADGEKQQQQQQHETTANGH